MLLADLDLRRSKVFIHIGRPTWKVISEPPPHAFFSSMQEIFQEDFAERYAWGSVCDYFTPSGDEAPALYNSQSL